MFAPFLRRFRQLSPYYCRHCRFRCRDIVAADAAFAVTPCWFAFSLLPPFFRCQLSIIAAARHFAAAAADTAPLRYLRRHFDYFTFSLSPLRCQLRHAFR